MAHGLLRAVNLLQL